MRSAKVSFLLVLTLAACFGGDSDDDDEFSCPALVGSCPVLSESYCVDIAAERSAIPGLQRACPSFTTTTCNTAGTVGGCRFRRASEGKCDTYWWFPPKTTDFVRETCPEFLPSP